MVVRSIAVLSLLCLSLPVAYGVQSAPLIRTITVAGDPLQVLADQPSGHVAVVGYGAQDRYGNVGAPSALTVLDGKMGANDTTLRAHSGVEYLPLRAVDGSGHIYIAAVHLFTGSYAVDAIGASGMLHGTGYPLPSGSVGSLATDPGVDRLVVAGASQISMEGYDLRTGKHLYSTAIGASLFPLAAVALDRTTRSVFVIGYTSLLVLDARSGRLKTQAQLDPTGAAALAERSHRLVTLGWPPSFSTDQGEIQVRDTRTLRVLHTLVYSLAYGGGLLTPEPGISALAAMPVEPLAVDTSLGRAIVIAPAEEQVPGGPEVKGIARLINLGTGTVLHTAPLGLYAYAVAIDSRLHRAYVANHDSDTVTVIDLRKGVVVATVGTGGGPVSVAIDQRHQTVFVANSTSTNGGTNGTVTMFDARIAGNHTPSPPTSW